LRESRSAEPVSRQIWVLAAVAVAARVLFIFLYRIDTDEPQHLHVAWGWSRGLVQYRDVFDNHFPLLHLLFAPLVSVAPEDSTVFLWMRLAIAPIAIAAAWLLYILGRPLVDPLAAAIAAITFSVMPPWLPTSVEFRNDTLWIFFWLAALALITGRRRPAFAFAGIAASLCLLASVKAAPLLIAHVLALVSQRQGVSPKNALRFAGGAAIPLIAIGVFMAAHGALDEMAYGTVLYNGLLPVHPVRRIAGAVAFILVAPVLTIQGVRTFSRRDPLAMHLTLFAIWYTVVLLCFWPRISSRDFLPLVPLAALALASIRVTRMVPAAVVLGTILTSVWYARLWRTHDSFPERFVDAVTQLTAPDDLVYDQKGESVFRRRAVYFIYETVGRALTSNGTLPDRGPEEIVARGSCVAAPDSWRLPQRTRTFLNTHFLITGPLRVCGTIARDGAFTIAVPQTYAVLVRDPSGVEIDGVPYRGPRFLTSGRHIITTASKEPATIIWARAAGRAAQRAPGTLVGGWRASVAPPEDRALAVRPYSSDPEP
jgi:hypothetical protein